MNNATKHVGRIKPDDSLLTFASVQERTGISRTTLWRYEKAGKFPQRIYLSERSPRWIKREVDEWVVSLAENKLSTR